jgi:hypothetical protein
LCGAIFAWLLLRLAYQMDRLENNLGLNRFFTGFMNVVKALGLDQAL